jgi:transcriptional regulator with XRE-family HTH domain
MKSMAYVEPMTVAELVSIRIDLDWTQLRLAESLGIHHTNVAQWEKGKRKIPAAKAQLIRGIHSEIQAMRRAHVRLGPDPAQTFQPALSPAPQASFYHDLFVWLAVFSFGVTVVCGYWLWSWWPDLDWLSVFKLLVAGVCGLVAGCAAVVFVPESSTIPEGNF